MLWRLLFIPLYWFGELSIFRHGWFLFHFRKKEQTKNIKRLERHYIHSLHAIFLLLSILIYSTQGMVYFFFTCDVILMYVHSNNDVKTPAASILWSRTTRNSSLELLWTVYSEEKSQSCSKLRSFQNLFNEDKSIGL